MSDRAEYDREALRNWMFLVANALRREGVITDEEYEDLRDYAKAATGWDDE